MNPENIKSISEVLAALIAERDEYTYVDKLGYAPSRDLAIYYLREALRDLHSLIRSGSIEKKGVKELLRKIRFDRVERGLREISEIRDRKELREVTSLISSNALSLSASLIRESQEKEKGEE